MTRTLGLGALVSGEGTTLEALAEEIAGGHLPAHIALVVADRPHAPAIEKARHRGLPTAVLPLRGQAPERWSEALTALLVEHGVDLVLLLGFLAILPTDWVRNWRGRVLNLHPSLLPRHGGPGMYGRHVHEAVLASGDGESGATVHLVTEDVDGGPILGQERIPVLPGDTPEVLRSRVRPVERALLFSVIRHFADGSWPLPYPTPEKRPAPPGPRS